MSTFIIVEAGVNHNGSFELAKKLIDQAKLAGADCIKFQTFKASKLVSRNAPKADYQKKQTCNNESQFDMLKNLELQFDEFVKLKEYCKKIDIEFLSTAFDDESIEFLEDLGINRWKVPSGEITNLPYLERLAKTGKPIILSTGMSTMKDIENALDVLRRNEVSDITVLHCTTEYPTPLVEVNLKAMDTISKVFGVKIGYSDHTMGIEVPIAAVAMGATVIEKHFTLDKNMEGPDHKASVEPVELKEMVTKIRNIEKALGTGIKEPTPSEVKNMKVARKSIVTKRKIHKNEILSEENLCVKRPGNGVSPMKWYDVIGMKAIREFDEDELIEI